MLIWWVTGVFFVCVFFSSDVHVPRVRVCLQRVRPPERLEWPPLDSNVAFFRRDSHFSTSHVFESNKMSQILIFLEKIKNHADLMSYGCFFYSNVHVPKVRVCLQRVCPPERLEWPPLDSNVAFLRRGSHFSTSHVFESNKMSQILIFLEKIKNHADLMSYECFFFFWRTCP